MTVEDVEICVWLVIWEIVSTIQLAQPHNPLVLQTLEWYRIV